LFRLSFDPAGWGSQRLISLYKSLSSIVPMDNALLRSMCARLDYLATHSASSNVGTQPGEPHSVEPQSVETRPEEKRQDDSDHRSYSESFRESEQELDDGVTFDELYETILQRAQEPAQKLNPSIKRLDFGGRDEYRVTKLTEYTMKGGSRVRIDSINELIHRINTHTKNCKHSGGRGRPSGFRTFERDDTKSTPTKLPNGLHVFSVPQDSTPSLQEAALFEIEELFNQQLNLRTRDPFFLQYNPSPRSNVILFLDAPNPRPFDPFKTVMQRLHSKCPALTEYILIYCKQFMQLLGISQDELEKANLTLVFYPEEAGLNPHVDSTEPFEGSIGPILTIGMGKGIKMLDMLPSLEDSEFPVRIYSEPNQFFIMDGRSRVTWSHCLPWLRRGIKQWTVAIKFPQLRGSHVTNERFSYDTRLGYTLVSQIPYHLEPNYPIPVA
jgi:hypothetical protein